MRIYFSIFQDGRHFLSVIGFLPTAYIQRTIIAMNLKLCISIGLVTPTNFWLMTKCVMSSCDVIKVIYRSISKNDRMDLKIWLWGFISMTIRNEGSDLMSRSYISHDLTFV